VFYPYNTQGPRTTTAPTPLVKIFLIYIASSRAWHSGSDGAISVSALKVGLCHDVPIVLGYIPVHVFSLRPARLRQARPRERPRAAQLPRREPSVDHSETHALQSSPCFKIVAVVPGASRHKQDYGQAELFPARQSDSVSRLVPNGDLVLDDDDYDSNCILR